MLVAALALSACATSTASSRLPKFNLPAVPAHEREAAKAPLPGIPKQGATGVELVTLTGKHRAQLIKTQRALRAAHKRDERIRTLLKGN